MLSDRYGLSVTLVYCGQTVGWIRTPLGTKVGLGPGHTVLDGDPAPPFKRPQQSASHFSAAQFALALSPISLSNQDKTRFSIDTERCVLLYNV